MVAKYNEDRVFICRKDLKIVHTELMKMLIKGLLVTEAGKALYSLTTLFVKKLALQAFGGDLA